MSSLMLTLIQDFFLDLTLWVLNYNIALVSVSLYFIKRKTIRKGIYQTET